MPLRTRGEQRSIGLYAVLARDPSDFLDMLREEPIEVLQTLHEMLTYVGPETPKDDVELNAFGAKFVASILKDRGAEPRFAQPNLPPFED